MDKVIFTAVNTHRSNSLQDLVQFYLFGLSASTIFLIFLMNLTFN